MAKYFAWKPEVRQRLPHDFAINGLVAALGDDGLVDDRINLSAIDANVLLPCNQAFTFIGTRPFASPLLPAKPGQVRVSDLGGETLVQGNTDFDRDPEGEVLVNDGAVTAAAWGAAAFLL